MISAYFSRKKLTFICTYHFFVVSLQPNLILSNSTLELRIYVVKLTT